MESRRVISATATLSDTAYSAGDQVGGLLTFADCADTRNGSAIVESLAVVDNEKINAALVLFLFSKAPSLAADNAAFSISDADSLYCLGSIVLAAADYKGGALNSVATKSNVMLQVKNEDAQVGAALCQNVYGALMVDSGSPDWSASGSLKLRLGVRR